MMKIQISFLMITLGLLGSTPIWAADAQSPGPATIAKGATTTAASQKVHYKSGKDVNFEDTLIHGQLQKPELLIVTGNGAETSDGLLRLRENFLDRMSMGLGEDVQ